MLTLNVQTQLVYLLSSGPEGSFGSHKLIESDPQSEIIDRVVVLLSSQQLWSHKTCRRGKSVSAFQKDGKSGYFK